MTEDNAQPKRSDIEDIRLLLRQLEDAAARAIEAAPQITAPQSTVIRNERPAPLEFAASEASPSAAIPDPRTQLARLGQVRQHLPAIEPPTVLVPPDATSHAASHAASPPIVRSRRMVPYLAAGLAAATAGGAVVYAGVRDVPVLSPYVHEARSRLTQFIETRLRPITVAGQPENRVPSPGKPTPAEPLEVVTIDAAPPPQPADPVIAAGGARPSTQDQSLTVREPAVGQDSAGGGDATQSDATRADDPAAGRAASPAQQHVMLQASMLSPITLPSAAPEVVVTKPAEAATGPADPTASDASAGQPDPESPIERHASAQEPSGAGAAEADSPAPALRAGPSPATPPSPASALADRVEPQLPSTNSAADPNAAAAPVRLFVNREIRTRRDIAAPLGLMARNSDNSASFLLVVRGVPAGVKLSKGSPIGVDSWFMPAVGLADVTLSAPGAAGPFTLKFELVTADGRILSVAEASVFPGD